MKLLPDGGEAKDHELVCRLINSGVRKRTIKFAGIVFPPSSSRTTWNG